MIRYSVRYADEFTPSVWVEWDDPPAAVRQAAEQAAKHGALAGTMECDGETWKWEEVAP